MDALEYCVRVLKARDYDNFAAMVTMPSETRGRILSLLALNAEVSVIRQVVEGVERDSGPLSSDDR